MDGSDNAKYRLYALKAGDMPSDAEFYFLLPDIDLVYTQTAPANGVEVKSADQIPAEARVWLVETIQTITNRYLTENEEALLEGSKTFLDRFRAELETERKKAARKIRVKARAKEHGNE